MTYITDFQMTTFALGLVYMMFFVLFLLKHDSSHPPTLRRNIRFTVGVYASLIISWCVACLL
jgi:hypothetical protein